MHDEIAPLMIYNIVIELVDHIVTLQIVIPYLLWVSSLRQVDNGKENKDVVVADHLQQLGSELVLKVC